MPRLLLIDNYDSFTYNLVQCLFLCDTHPIVIRNDELTIRDALNLNPTHLVLSPGPGRPEQAGILLKLIEVFEQKIPILGICLGHQAIALHFGASVTHAKEILHGKQSQITHTGTGLFKKMKSPMQAGRYHSLAVEKLPKVLQVTATSSDGEVMGIEHTHLPIYGLQFHPESILSPEGPMLFRSFLD